MRARLKFIPKGERINGPKVDTTEIYMENTIIPITGFSWGFMLYHIGHIFGWDEVERRKRRIEADGGII